MTSILLIDNHSKHIDSLAALLACYGGVYVVDSVDLADTITKEYDLVVLSGGSDRPVYTDPAYYGPQTKLLGETRTPVIGICLGAELIAYTFGGHLMQLPQKLTCTMPIRYIDPLFDGMLTSIRVAERHRWCIVGLGAELVSLARSSFGHEIIRHKNKPIYGLQFHPEIDPVHLGGDEILDRILSSLGFCAALIV